MSFRAAFVRLKQLAAEVLARKRVFLITGKAHKQEGLLQANPRPLPRKDPTTPFNHLQRVFVGYQSNSASWAAQLRRNAALRLIQSRSLVGRGVGGRGRLPIYAFLGLTLAAGERSVLGGNDGAVNENEKMRGRLPLETCCEIVRGVFQNQRPNDELQCPADEEPFPSDTASYDISDQLLGKGTSASIYAARLTPLPSIEGAVDDAMGAEEDVSGDDGLSFQEDDSEDREMVSNETEERLGEDAAGSMELSSWESLDDVADADDDVVVEEEESKGGRPVKDEAGGGYDLALKMMFNYDIASNAIALSRTFEREYLPLWPSLESGSFGDFRWENGHRAKKKDRRFLPSHPNIAVIHHVFVAPTVAHDLEEARTLFPAALPARLHIDGMGRNQTMYLVMKRYDMTLAEYNQSMGCPTQQVAMTIIAQLLEGVAYLVHHGIAHRDLKSNNILVERTEGSPHVVIADFGCCLADDAVGLQLPYPSRHTEIGGNSALMAPEVKLAIPGPAAKINYAKSDAWAVGAISFEVLGLPNPFYRHGDNHPGLDSAQYEDADLLAMVPDNVHHGLGKIIRLLLKKDPSERPSATVAANMLYMLLWQLPVFTVASWEGSKLVPAVSLQQQQMATWLLNLSAGVLCQRSPGGQTASTSHRSWLDDTEYQLCLTFLSRVTSRDLMTAARRLVP